MDLQEGTAFPRGGSAPTKKNKRASSDAPSADGGDDVLFGRSSKKPSTSKKTSSRKRSLPSSAQGDKKKNKKTVGGPDNGNALDNDDADDISNVVQGLSAPSRAHYLTFKRLRVGMRVLGMVKAINDTSKDPRGSQAVIALPNGLNGVLKYAQLSDHLASNATAQSPRLSSFIHVGMYLRCVVVDATAGVASSGKSKATGAATSNRIELSTRAALVNKLLAPEDLAQKDSLVAGNIKSVEDHGYLVDLGMGTRLTGFLPFNIAGGSVDEPALTVGQPIMSIVLSALGKGAQRSLKLSNDPVILAKTTTKDVDELELTTLQPGSLVSVTIKRILPNGLWVSFLGLFAGTVDLFHLNTAPVVDWEAKYAAGKRRTFTARVLYVDEADKQVALSMRPHVVSWTEATDLPEVGTVFDGAQVQHVDARLGVLATLTDAESDSEEDVTMEDKTGSSSDSDDDSDDEVSKAKAAAKRIAGSTSPGSSSVVLGYAHVSKLFDDDDKKNKLEKHFRAGGAPMKCRVTGVSPLDGLVNISFQPSVIDAAVVRYDDLSPGMVVQGKVIKVEPEYVIVSLGSGVSAIITLMHMSDATVKDPSKRFKNGQMLKCRVLQVDPKTRKAQLTHMKTIVESSLPAVVSYEQAAKAVDAAADGAPLVAHGFVSSIQPFGVIVTMFNDVHGLVPTDKLKQMGVANIAKAYRVGQVVKARVVNVNARRSKMSLSLRTNPSASDISAENAEKIESASFASKPSATIDVSIGNLVSGTIVTVTENDVFIRLDGPDGPAKGAHSHDDVRGRIPIAHLSDHTDNVEGLMPTFTQGSRVVDAVVLEIPKTRSRSGKGDSKERAGSVLPLVLSRKPALVIAAKHGLLPSRIEQVSVGQELTGFVGNVTPFGVFVRFLSGLSALAPRANTSDLYGADPVELYTVGQTVLAKVTDVNSAKQRIVVTLKPSVVNGLDSFFLSGLWSERRYAFQHDVAISKKANKKAAASGGDEALADDVSDKVALKQLKIGQACEATVLQVKDYGLILELAGGAVGFCMKEHAPKHSPATGAKLTCRVLDIDYQKGVVDVTMRQRLVKAARERLPTIDPSVAASIAETDSAKSAPVQKCTVELIKSHYAVVSLPDHKHAFALAPISTFNGRPKGLDGLAVGVRCQCHLLGAPEADAASLSKYGRLPLPVVRLVSDAQLGERRPRALSEANSEGEAKPTAGKRDEERVRVEAGALVRAKIKNIKGEWVLLTLANCKRSKGVVMKARVHISNMREPPAQDAMLEGKKKIHSVLSRVNVGNMIKKCRVIRMHKECSKAGKVVDTAADSDSEDDEPITKATKKSSKALMVEVTMRPSHMKLDIEELAKVGKDDVVVKVGEVRAGWIKAITAEGLWVAFSTATSGLVFCANVSSELERVQEILCGGDNATATVKERLGNYFEVGQPVYARVLVGESTEGKTRQAMSLALVDN